MNPGNAEEEYWSRLFGRGKRVIERFREGLYTNTIGMELVWCPAGKFTMGSPETEEGREPDEVQRKVKLTKGFWMGKQQVSQRFWRYVMSTNPSKFTRAPNRPAESMSFEDAMEFCERLTKADRASRKLPKGAYYTLPTEAQWEYACRAGTETAFSCGDSFGSRHGNCDGRLPYGEAKPGKDWGETRPVGKYKPNPWGLHDMHGNVYEWCLDPYGPYNKKDTKDPLAKGEPLRRAVRGGSWYDPAVKCRSAARTYGEPGPRRLGALGVRVVLVAPSD